MQLYPTLTGDRIVQPAVAAAEEAIFTQPFVAKSLDRQARFVEAGYVVHHRNQIEDGLGTNARNGRRSDVVDCHDLAAQPFQQACRFLLGRNSPGRIVRLEVDRKAGHAAGYGTSTVAPTVSRASMARCASATSLSGSLRLMTGRTLPERSASKRSWAEASSAGRLAT